MPRLIERGGLLARLTDAHAEGGRLLFVGGEAGVGKTALVRAFLAGVEGRVLFGACEQFAMPPLGPHLDVTVAPDVADLIGTISTWAPTNSKRAGAAATKGQRRPPR